MYLKEDAEMMKRIFGLSDHALVNMINRMFRKEYRTDTEVFREWDKRERLCVRLTVGCLDMYEYRLFHEGSCFQVQATECGGRYDAGKTPLRRTDWVRDRRVIYRGGNVQEEGSVIREYQGRERTCRMNCTVTLADCSAAGLREMGMTLFLPYLFYWFLRRRCREEEKADALRYLLIYDIPKTLENCLKGDELLLYDVQKLKQFCRKMAWELLVMEEWVQSVEMQRLILETLDTDLDLLEHSYQTALGHAHRQMLVPVHKENTN